MGRPRGHYIIGPCPQYGSFRPYGCECNEYVEIAPEEIESLRLKNIKNFDQTQAAKKMGISQSTFQRILTSAYKKVSEAILYGKELRIIGDKTR